MNLRLVEVYLPEENGKGFEELISEYSSLEVWQKKLENNRLLFKILLSSGEVEPLVDCLVTKFGSIPILQKDKENQKLFASYSRE